MRTDDELRAWRDAAQSGGLPAPHRERWQALRAGVVNLWEFEAVEYWYADGWVYNDSRNDPVADYPGAYSGTIGYICEFEG